MALTADSPEILAQYLLVILDDARERAGGARQVMSDASAISTSFDPKDFVWTGTPLGQAKSLPSACYTSHDFFRAEIEHIHRKSWHIVARRDEFQKAGDYRAIDTVAGPVILIRGEDGEINAFANICRHRGSMLLHGCGNARTIICPYHAWTFRSDGTLAGAPAMGRTPGFEPRDHGLLPVRLETWAGFLFVNFSASAPSLLDDLGNLPELLASHRMDEMVCTWRKDFEANCNWKLLVENATETYHTGLVHAKTVGAQKSYSFPARGEWLAIQVQSEGSIAVLSDKPPFPHIADLSAQSRKGTYFAIFHPTTQFACAQDCVWWLSVRPISPDRTQLSIGGCFPRATTELPGFAADALPYYERWERVALEDIGILQKQQVALNSPLYRPGPLSWRDDQVHTFDQWILGRLPPEFRPA
jgi:phenylpropionate dioxygenase-like ring-hydroxylating dioxygenase large terminal subunit